MSVQVPSDAVCLQCKYHLYGLPEPRCPECGRAFDPGNSATYLASDTPRLAQWAQPPHGFMSVAVAVLTCLFLEDASRPFPYDPVTIFLAFVIGGMAIVDWLVRMTAWVKLMSDYAAENLKKSLRSRWHWFFLPLCAILMISAVCSNWPVRMRFALSIGDFERTVSAIQMASPMKSISRIGLYRIEAIRLGPNGEIWFSTGYRGWFSDGKAGFWFSPTGRSSSGHLRSTSLGHWSSYFDS